MRRLNVFNHISLDGYFVDGNGDMRWAHKQDAEWNAFANENAGGGGELVFGRVTYDLMVSFWPTPQAMQSMPVVAERMNQARKIVFSKHMDQPAWNNTKLVKDNIAEEMRKMKNEPGENMTILGSGTIVSQMAQAGLIDEYQIVINPIVLGKGRTLFEGVDKKLPLTLVNTRTFANGNVVMSYKAA